MSDQVTPETDAPLQFERVELATPASAQACVVCKTSIADTYFAVGGSVVCPACSAKLGGAGGGRAAFLRAWLWGGGAAVLGTIVWFLIAKLTGMELGIVAVAVGYAVGLAVRRGSHGRGGAKYQLLAMFLTYASIATSSVPFVIKGLAEGAKKHDAAEAAKTSGKTDDGTPEAAAAAREESAARLAKTKDKVTIGAVALALLIVVGISLVAPFMGGTSGIMGLVIIAIALYEAWKLNRRVAVTGPFRVGGALASSGAPVGTP